MSVGLSFFAQVPVSDAGDSDIGVDTLILHFRPKIYTNFQKIAESGMWPALDTRYFEMGNIAYANYRILQHQNSYELLTRGITRLRCWNTQTSPTIGYLK